MFKVIIVDDEKIVRIAMQNIIDWESHGFKIVALAKDGEEALEIFKSVGADLIITDLKMKGINGIELIEKLKSNNFLGKTIVLSNHGEYELVREAMKKGADDYLIKVTLKANELEEIIDKFRESLNESIIEKDKNNKLEIEFNKTKRIAEVSMIKEYLKGEISYEEFCEEFLYSKELENNLKGLVGGCIYIDNYKGIYKEKIKDKGKLIITIENIIKEEIKGVYFIPINSHKYIFLCNIDFKFLKSKAINIQNLIELYLNIKCSLVLLSNIEGLHSLKEKFKIVGEILSFRFYGQERCIKIAEEFEGFGDSSKLKKEVSDLILENIEFGDVYANRDLVEEFARRSSKLQVKPSVLIKDISFMCELIENHEYVFENLDIIRELKIKLLKSDSIEELVENSSNLIVYLNKRFIKNKEISYKKQVHEVMNFVEKNIDKRITLVMVSRAVNLNESYLSRIFKNETGKNLMYFINEVKMKRAKELLKRSDILVKEVASSVGITDQFYFNRVFKKFYGVSPSKYKKEYINRIFN